MTEESIQTIGDFTLESTLATRLAEKEFEALTRRRQGSSTTGAAVGQLIPPNPNRISLTVVNTSPNPIYIGFSPNTSTIECIVLVANGGALTQSFRDEGQSVGDAIYGLSVAGADAFAWFETELWGSK